MARTLEEILETEKPEIVAAAQAEAERILKDIDWMKKERRRMNRNGKSSPILNVV